MNYYIIDVLIIFSAIGLFIFYNGFKSNLDFISIAFIYLATIGILSSIYLSASVITNFIGVVLKYSQKALSIR